MIDRSYLRVLPLLGLLALGRWSGRPPGGGPGAAPGDAVRPVPARGAAPAGFFGPGSLPEPEGRGLRPAAPGRPGGRGRPGRRPAGGYVVRAGHRVGGGAR